MLALAKSLGLNHVWPVYQTHEAVAEQAAHAAIAEIVSK